MVQGSSPANSKNHRERERERERDRAGEEEKNLRS